MSLRCLAEIPSYGPMVDLAIGVACAVVGAIVGIVGSSYSARRDNTEKELGEKTQALVNEKVEGAAAAIHERLDGHSTRLVTVEGRIVELSHEQHTHELKFTAGLSSLRELIARECASKTDVKEALKEVVQEFRREMALKQEGN